MMGTMFYKGILGSVERDEEGGYYYGQVLGTTDIVLYDGETLDLLRKDFEFMAQTYLDDCEIRGRSPRKVSDFDINKYLAATA